MEKETPKQSDQKIPSKRVRRSYKENRKIKNSPKLHSETDEGSPINPKVQNGCNVSNRRVTNTLQTIHGNKNKNILKIYCYCRVMDHVDYMIHMLLQITPMLGTIILLLKWTRTYYVAFLLFYKTRMIESILYMISTN